MDYYVTDAVLCALHDVTAYKNHWKLNDTQNEKQGKCAQKTAQSEDEQTGTCPDYSTSAFLWVYIMEHLILECLLSITYLQRTLNVLSYSIPWTTLWNMYYYPHWADEELGFEKVSNTLKIT